MLLSDWANIASIVSSLAVLAILGQVFIGYRQIKADHERSRRERSVELLLEWSKQVCSNKKGSLARKLIESLSEENCRGIFNQEQVGLSHKYKDVISQIFDQDDCVNNDHKEDECADIMLNVSQSAELRWYAMLSPIKT